MKLRICRLLAFVAFVSCFLVGARALAQSAYMTNTGDTVSVIDSATNAVTAAIPVGSQPYGVSVTPDGSKVYDANNFANTVSVIDAGTNSVTTTIPVGGGVGQYPNGVSVSPDGSKVYVANQGASTVSVIDTATTTVTATIPVGSQPRGVLVSPDGNKVYVANFGNATVSVIDTAMNTVTATIRVGPNPISLGVFIQPGQMNPSSSLLVITGGKEPAFAFTAFFAPGASSPGLNPPRPRAIRRSPPVRCSPRPLSCARTVFRCNLIVNAYRSTNGPSSIDGVGTRVRGRVAYSR